VHRALVAAALAGSKLAVLIAVECGVFALGAGLIRISMGHRLGLAAQGLVGLDQGFSGRLQWICNGIAAFKPRHTPAENARMP
jgi:hypothetical protein